MSILERTRQLLLSPRAAWPVIAESGERPQQVMTGHVAPLAALSALAGFIGMSLVGVGAFGLSVRVPVLAGLAQMVVAFVMALVMVGLLAWLAQWLAPRFGGVADTRQAFKLAGYSATAGLLGGLFQILPMLAVLGLLAAFYSLYLLYTGLPVMMKNRPEDTLKYTLVLLVAMVVFGVAIGMVSRLFVPGTPGAVGKLGAGSGRDAPVIAIDTPEGRVNIDVNTEALEKLGKRFEAAISKADQAAAKKAEAVAAREAAKARAGSAPISSGSDGGGGTPSDAKAVQQGVEEAMGAVAGMLGAIAGGDDAKAGQPPASAEQMVAALPDTLAGLPRVSLKQQTGGALNTSMVNAEYKADERRLTLGLTHQRFIAAVIAFQPEEKSEDEQRVVHNRRDRDRGWYIEEKYERDGSHAKLSVTLSNGVRLDLNGRSMDRGAVEAALRSLPLEQMAKW